jgi:phosphoglycerate kinase
LRPVANRLSELLGRPVAFVEDCIGDDVKRTIDRMHASGGGVVLLENLRFHSEEEKNDPAFAKALASLADLYVNDAFGAAHRAHASVEAITRDVPRAAAGLLMERELQYLGHALEAPERPFVAILGGAKVSDKLEVIETLLGKGDRLLIGGAMAYTFLKSRGVPIGRSLVEDDKLEAARGLERLAAERHVGLEVPRDHVVADRVEAGRRTRCWRSATRASETGSASTSGRPRSSFTRRRSGREDRRVERADGRLRDRGVRDRHQRGGARGRRGPGHDDRRRRRLDRGRDEGRDGRPHYAHLDRRRRIARISRRPHAAWRRGAHGQMKGRVGQKAMRTPFIAGNWKMFKTVQEAVVFVKELRGS